MQNQDTCMALQVNRAILQCTIHHDNTYTYSPINSSSFIRA